MYVDPHPSGISSTNDVWEMVGIYRGGYETFLNTHGNIPCSFDAQVRINQF